jgi:hypothetical protein
VIVRTWTARATEAGAEDYRNYFSTTLLPELRALPGFHGALLLSRPIGDLVELTAHTMWESLAAIESFAGDDLTAAKVEPEAQAMLRESDTRVVHRTALLADVAMP